MSSTTYVGSSLIKRAHIEFLFWWHYGAVGQDKFFRAFLAMLSGLSLIAFVLDITHIINLSAFLPPKLEHIKDITNMKDLATALGISSAIMAGACTTFMSALAQHTAGTVVSESHDIRSRALMTIYVAFVASFIATVTFGVLYAITTETPASAQHWAIMYSALTLMVTSSLLLIFVLILLIPNEGGKRLGDELGTVFSYTWPVFFCLLILMAQAAPSWGRDAGPAILFAIFISTLQIVVPYGSIRWRRGDRRFALFVDSMRSRANILFMWTIMVAFITFSAVIVWPQLNRSLILIAIYAQMVLWSLGLVFLQIWVEGTRKMCRYKRFSRDFLDHCPQLTRLLSTKSNTSEQQ